MPSNNNVVTMDHLRSRKQPTVRKIKITMTSEIDEELQNAQQEAGMSEFLLGASDALKEEDPEKYEELIMKNEAAKERLKKAQKEADKDSVEFKFRSIGRKAFDKLVGEHQPTEADKAMVTAQGDDPNGLQWSPETFPPALMAASILHPVLSLEEIQELWTSEDWEPAALSAIFQCAISAQNSRRVVEVGNV